MTRFLLAICALATAVLGFEKVGAYQFVPGDPTGFHFQHFSNKAGYSLSHRNTGSLTAWLKLVVRTKGSGTWIVPVNWSGDPLAIVEGRYLGDQKFEISIYKKPVLPEGTPFVWGPGIDLQIVDEQGYDFDIIDWTVFPTDQAVDSKDLAWRRQAWTIGSWMLLPLALLGAIISAVNGKGPTKALIARTDRSDPNLQMKTPPPDHQPEVETHNYRQYLSNDPTRALSETECFVAWSERSDGKRLLAYIWNETPGPAECSVQLRSLERWSDRQQRFIAEDSSLGFYRFVLLEESVRPEDSRKIYPLVQVDASSFRIFGVKRGSDHTRSTTGKWRMNIEITMLGRKRRQCLYFSWDGKRLTALTNA